MTTANRWYPLGLVALAVLGVGASACRKKETPAPTTTTVLKVEDVVTKYKPQVQPKVTAALKIGANLPKPPAHETLKVEKGTIHLLVGSTSKIAAGDAGAQAGNATILDPEQLKGDLTTNPNVKYGMGENLLVDCAAILAGKSLASNFNPTTDPKQTGVVLERCAAISYLLVLIPSKKVDPLVDKPSKKFVPGHVEGDVLVFDLDSGKHLGGFKVSGQNSATLLVNMDDPWQDLRSEMSKKLWASIESGLTKQAPGSSIVNLY